MSSRLHGLDAETNAMKIKRYFAPDIRQAIRMVRDEQRPGRGDPVEPARPRAGSRSWPRSTTRPRSPTSIPRRERRSPHRRRARRARPAASARASGVARRRRPRTAMPPTIAHMGRELKTLRGMLEHQLSATRLGRAAAAQASAARCC
ncbi:MAG: hypothetical protein MZV65_54565 [Chromatiales bacterium]|nr:hypothetical protein [Chromatiales bacterium]